MARVFITGSAEGLGRLTAQMLLAGGHDVIVHARNTGRLASVRDLVDQGATAVVGELSTSFWTHSMPSRPRRCLNAHRVSAHATAE